MLQWESVVASAGFTSALPESAASSSTCTQAAEEAPTTTFVLCLHYSTPSQHYEEEDQDQDV
eukprot:454007-Amphidinium_carterae.1